MTSPGALLEGVRDTLRRPEAETGERFVDKPYASVQLLLLVGAGLLGFGILMAVSTTIAASHDDAGTSAIRLVPRAAVDMDTRSAIGGSTATLSLICLNMANVLTSSTTA